ncbi:MAG TPA: TRAP transporter substrate-binding protein DctP [Vicinamibacterales bacterium]|nr:TRAP transporter substrate-binding protein DctP [Vicinamibacterales bacterium]
MSSVKRVLVLLALVVSIAPLAAAPLQIKLATLVPATSLWEKALLEMGNTWNKDTAGRVTLTVYAGSTDTEGTILTQMRPTVDRYQAVYISNVGLAGLDEAFNVLAMPFFLESDEEDRAVKKKLTPLFEQRLEAKGLHFLSWGTGGWVQLFSKKPLRTLTDVKAAKLFTSKGADKWVRWYVANGFHPVELVPASVPEQLKLSTGLIDTAAYVPYLASLQQVFRDAKYMLDVHVAPLAGALIMSDTAWNKISPEDRVKVTAAAQALEERVHADIPKQDADSIKSMQQRGLQVITADPKAAADFRAAANQLVSTIRGEMVPADVFDMAVQARDAVRKAKGK